jgi:hypothetical protein
MKWKRIITMVLFALVLLVANACGASGVPPTPTPTPTDVFSIEEAYCGSSDKIIETGVNFFEVIGQTLSGQAVPTIDIPINFYTLAEDVTYNFYCNGVEGYSFYAESEPDEEKSEKWINLEEGDFFFWSHFGFWTADPFILSNMGDFGTHIDYVGEGLVRITLFLSNFPNEDLCLKCHFNVVSEEPPFKRTTELYIRHIR